MSNSHNKTALLADLDALFDEEQPSMTPQQSNSHNKTVLLADLDALFDEEQPSMTPQQSLKGARTQRDQHRPKVQRLMRDALKMGIEGRGLKHRLQKRVEGIQRQKERAPLVQQRDLFGQAGEVSHGLTPRGHRLYSTTAEPRLQEAFDLGLTPKPHRLLIGTKFFTPPRFDRSLRGRGDGLTGDPIDPYTVAHAIGRVVRLVGTPSKMISVSLCGEAGAPGRDVEGDSTRGPIGHILWGLRIDRPVYDIHPFLFANGEIPAEINLEESLLTVCTNKDDGGLTLKWVADQPEEPTVIFRHLPLVADRFGIQKYLPMLEPETVLQVTYPAGQVHGTVELASTPALYRQALCSEMQMLNRSKKIKPGTVLILTAPALAPLRVTVEDELTSDNGWTLLESFVVHEESGWSKHAHDGRSLHPRTVSIWKKNQPRKEDGLTVVGGAE